MPPSAPSAAWGRLQPCGLVGFAPLGGWQTATLPPAVTWGPGSPPLPSPPVFSLPFTSSSFSPHPLRPLDVTPGASLFCASVSSHKTWDEEKQPPGVAGGGRSEAGGRNHESTNEQRRWNCSGLSSLQFFTPQVSTPPLLGSLSCCANLDPRL